MTAIGPIVKGTLDYSAAKAGINLDLSPLDDSWTSVKQVIGSRFNDVITGNLMMYMGTISGEEGNDLLASRGLITTFDGGNGSDTVSYVDNYDGVDVDLSTGISVGGDVLIGVENLIGGMGNNTLVGNASANRLVGGPSGDWIDGGEGADYMAGGGSSDIYLVDNVGDVVVENADGGTFDQVTSRISYTLPDNVEILALDGSAALNGTGNELNNNISGNGAANILSGLDGNDLLRGNAGNDLLLGGDGNDVLVGGRGLDKLVGGNGRDFFEFEAMSESTVSAPDHIMDFMRGQDRIFLRDIDARVTAPGNNAFAFIGSASFSGKEGELRYEAVGSDTVVTGDVNGDGVADFAIVLDDFTGAFRASDFVL